MEPSGRNRWQGSVLGMGQHVALKDVSPASRVVCAVSTLGDDRSSLIGERGADRKPAGSKRFIGKLEAPTRRRRERIPRLGEVALPEALCTHVGILPGARVELDHERAALR